LAEQDRRKSSGKSKPPITSHPLFPAIVALWFGALFGLGSLAIRPGLLESMVLALHIDTLVPAAAPPLGLTSRILLALVMSGIGGLIGATIAHRIAAPRPERRERRRGAGVVAGSAHGVSEGRRRPLTADVDYSPRDFDEHAPLPGGSPQILNVSDFDFDEPAPARPAVHALHANEPAPSPAPASVEVRLVGGRSADDAAVPAPLELDTFAEEEPGEPAQLPEAHVSLARPSAPVAAPVQPGRFDAPRPDSSYGFFALDEEPDQAALPDRFDAIAKAAPPLFGNRTPAPAVDASPAPVAVSVTPQPAAAPFAAPAAPFAAPAAPFAAPAATVTLAMNAAPPPPPFAQPVMSEPVAEPEPMAEAPAPAPVAAPAFVPPAGLAAERIASAELAELSPVELIERLALSLQARRERTAAPSAKAVEAAPAAEAPAPFVTPAAPQPAPAAPAVAPNFARPVQVTIALEGTGIVPPPVTIPAALRPIGIELDDDDGDHLESFLPLRHIPFTPAATPAPQAVPEPAEVHEAAGEPAIAPLAPAADFAGPALARLPRGDEPEAATAEVEEIEAADETQADDDIQTLEDGYSSLLDLTRRPQARQPFVRIEEPEPEGAAIEPVVIFPGRPAAPPRLRVRSMLRPPIPRPRPRGRWRLRCRTPRKPNAPCVRRWLRCSA